MASDNNFHDRPASKMQGGGRDITDFRPNSMLNNLIVLENNIDSNYSYRQYLQGNAQKIMNKNHEEVCARLGCDCGHGILPNVCETSDPKYGYDSHKSVRLSVPSGGLPPPGIRQILQ